MIKNIILQNGEVKPMTFNEEFINTYIKLGVRIYMEYKYTKKNSTNIALTEEEKQDIKVAMFEAFLEYDEQHAFSTLLTWKIKGMCSAQIAYNLADKRNVNNYEFLNLDYQFSDKEGEANTVHDVLQDERIDIEGNYEDRDFLNFIQGNLSNDFERCLLRVNLGEIQAAEASEILECTRANITQRNKTFKKKLAKLIEEYNKLK
jgi:DNA-directed RNA polymerase specialized sigma subunit